MYEQLNIDLVERRDDSTTTTNQLTTTSYTNLSHNSVLNCLFLLTSDKKLVLFDCNSRSKLKEVDWNESLAESLDHLSVYNIQDKCIIVGDRTLCSRLANDGSFLLDTVFQPTVPNLSLQVPPPPQTTSSGSSTPTIPPNTFMRSLEINVNDAASLLASLKQIEPDIIAGLDSLIAQLSAQLDKTRTSTKSSTSPAPTLVDSGGGGGGGEGDEETSTPLPLASSSSSSPSSSSSSSLLVENSSWSTVLITDSYFTLLSTLTQCLDEIKRTNLQSVAIPIISLLLDRLYRLDTTLIEKQLATNSNGTTASFGNSFDKRYMCSEATRRATFNEWPHMDYKWVLPDALAQAGFYHQPAHPGDDRTICFVCDLCLVAWEQHDQPWSEHERHSPICQFVRGELTENVPLALTAATQAAIQAYRLAPPGQDKIVCTSELSSERYFAVSNSTGHIIVYDSKDLLKEMMHVQLINESQYNKEQKLKVHSLCFYYRNHKHVLYGSFTINDEVFIFSFNIFDIYRSYHSKSNKKSSKSHSSKTSSSAAATNMTTAAGSSALTSNKISVSSLSASSSKTATASQTVNGKTSTSTATTTAVITVPSSQQTPAAPVQPAATSTDTQSDSSTAAPASTAATSTTTTLNVDLATPKTTNATATISKQLSKFESASSTNSSDANEAPIDVPSSVTTPTTTTAPSATISASSPPETTTAADTTTTPPQLEKQTSKEETVQAPQTAAASEDNQLDKYINTIVKVINTSTSSNATTAKETATTPPVVENQTEVTTTTTTATVTSETKQPETTPAVANENKETPSKASTTTELVSSNTSAAATPAPTTTPSTTTTTTPSTKPVQNQLATTTTSSSTAAANNYYGNMLSLIFNSAEAAAAAGKSGASGSNSGNNQGAIPAVVTTNSMGGNVVGFEIFSLNKNTITIQKPPTVVSSSSSSAAKQQQAIAAAMAHHHHHHQQQQHNAANLSNFLNVRFEITQNAADNKTAGAASTSSKSSKYRKSIKISSVSCRPLSALETGDMTAPDIQLKAYEFTEKCLSFRLASIDLNSDQQQQKRNFQVKLINLYEKFLCALVNFTLHPSGQPSFKLYRIKHEETGGSTSQSTTASPATATPTPTSLTPTPSTTGLTQTSLSTSSLSSMSASSSLAQITAATATANTDAAKKPTETKTGEEPTTPTPVTPPALFSGNCLAATSSSRLNLTEFILTSIPSASLNSHVRTIMPIAVSTLEDDNDLKYIAILSETGVISIIDPNRCCKLIDFPSAADDDRFVNMIYCYSIDKICAITASGKIFFISTRVFPLVNQSILDEMSGTINFNELSLTKKLLVDAPLDSNTLTNLHSLISFDNSKTNFSTKLPSNWTPILSDQQQQSKHPQHIHSESVNLTKSWKYINIGSTNGVNTGAKSSKSQSIDGTKTEDLNVEIYLNKPIQVGCIQLKLKFSRELTGPYELRLFRPKKSNEYNSKSVHSTIDFNLSEKNELIYGPVDVRDFLDQSNFKTYTITICSPKLYEARSNLIYMNLKYKSKPASVPPSGVNPNNHHQQQQSSSLQKIQITVRKYRRHGIPNETIERSLMLNKPAFFTKLLEFMFSPSTSSSSTTSNDPSIQIKALDLITWIFYNHSSLESAHLSFLKEHLCLSGGLEKLLTMCFLYGNRSISRKATMLLTFLLNPKLDPSKSFAQLLLDKLLVLMKFLLCFESSAPLNWFFTLFHQVMYLDPRRCYEQCIGELTKLSSGHKYNPFYALLKMRFNFSSLVFDQKLFDADLYFKFDFNEQKFSNHLEQQLQASGGGQSGAQSGGQSGNSAVGATTNLAQAAAQQQQQQQQLQSQQQLVSNAITFSFGSVGLSVNNPGSLVGGVGGGVGGVGGGGAGPSAALGAFGSSSSHSGGGAGVAGVGGSSGAQSSATAAGFLAGIASNGGRDLFASMHQPLGLLEVLPLNFKCVSSSSGTSIEKPTSAIQDSANSYYILPDFFSLFSANTENIENRSNDQSGSATGSNGSSGINNSGGGMVDTSIFNSIFHLNQLQYVMVERMEPVSRHFVVIDFGFPVALSDVMIPACSELSSLSIDVWLHKEQKDSKRLCVSTDISQNAILLNDMQPTPLCRYVKLIFVAYSTNIVKAKIPIGYYFGYPYVFSASSTPSELTPAPAAATTTDPLQPATTTATTAPQPPPPSMPSKSTALLYLSYLEKLYEDNKCHYSISVGKLRELLNEIQFPSDNIGHLKMMQFNFSDNNETTARIKEAYNECLDYQFQLNLNFQLIKKLRLAIWSEESLEDRLNVFSSDEFDAFGSFDNKVDLNRLIEEASQDQLRVTNNLLIKTLLCLTSMTSLDPLTGSLALTSDPSSSTSLNTKINIDQAFNLFCNLCVHGNLERECSWLLLRCCQSEPWWGKFIAQCLRNYFITQVKEPIPLSKIFISLNDMCLKSLQVNQMHATLLFKSLFGLVQDVLAPLVNPTSLDDDDDISASSSSSVEVTCLEWLLLFISRLLCVFNVNRAREASNRWEFLENIYAAQRTGASGSSGGKQAPVRSKNKIKKKFFQSNKYFTWNKIKETRKNLEKYRKHMWKSGSGGHLDAAFSQDAHSKLHVKKVHLPRDISLAVGRSISKLLVSSNSYCNSDLFVLSCRIISSLCCNTQPCISLSEIFEPADLNQLILLNVSSEFNHGSVCWGSPWSQHAFLSLLLDVIENERFVNEQAAVAAAAASSSTLPSSSADIIGASGDSIFSSRVIGSGIKLSNQKIPNTSSAQSNVLNLEKNLKIIEEMDEQSTSGNGEYKIAPSTVAEAVKITGDLVKNFSQINTILSNQLNGGGQSTPPSTTDADSTDSKSSEARKQQTSSTIEDLITETENAPVESTSTTHQQQQPATTSASDSNSGAKPEIIPNQVMKKLNELSQFPNVVTPQQHINSLFSHLVNNPNVSFTTLTSSSSSLNKKLAHFQKQTSACFGAISSLVNAGNRFSNDFASSANRLLASFSYDLRLDTSFYQTLENYLFVKLSMQNEAITNFTTNMLGACDVGVGLGSELLDLGSEVTCLESSSSSSSQQEDQSTGVPTTSKTIKSSSILLQETIEKLFEDLNNINIENLITFWLTLSTPSDCESSSGGVGSSSSAATFNPSASHSNNTSSTSFLYLNESTANYLLDYLNDYPYMTVKLWHLAFRMLTQLLVNGVEKQSSSIAKSFTLNEAMYKLVYKFLSCNEELVGDECCQSLVEFLRRFGECVVGGSGECERIFKMKLFHILAASIESDGCVNRSQGPIDAQVTFIEFLIGEDLLKCYELSNPTATTTGTTSSTSSSSKTSEEAATERNNTEFEQIVSRYFSNLSRLVQHHICTYPRLSIKGQTSPRSCFSGVLTSLLFGSGGSGVGGSRSATSNAAHALENKFKMGSSSYDHTASSSQYQPFSATFFGGSAASAAAACGVGGSGVAGSAGGAGKQRSLLSSAQSILCNRDILVCLLLKFGINLLADVKINFASILAIHDQATNGPFYSDIQADSNKTNTLEQNGDSALLASTLEQAANSGLSAGGNGGSLFEDDLLIQQLFLSDLQQVFDADSILETSGTLTAPETLSCELLPTTTTATLPEVLVPSPPTASTSIKPPPVVNTTSSKYSSKVNAAKSITEANLKKKRLIRILSNECLEAFIESLALCQSSALAMVISNAGYPIELTVDDIQTPGDGLFLLLKCIASMPLKLIEPAFSYLSKIKRLSEPLLWFLGQLFAQENVVRAFIDRGGLDVIAKGLSTTTRQLLYSGPCIVSSLMNLIDSERQQMKNTSAASLDTADSTEGFTNFAPFGSIICTSASGNPADVLLQNSAPHRRIRSAIWSYHFQPNDEHKVGLFITFPYAFLLKEVHILPHTVSFGNCPGYVSIEVSRDGSFMTPIGPPVYTMGMSVIKLQLNKSELVNTVQLNLYKSKDSQLIGLSQIRLLGYPMFENMLSAKPDMMLTPVEDLVSRSNMGWLRLLYMCLTTVPALEAFVCERITDATMLLCTRLLSSPAMIIYDKIIEQILIKFSKHNKKRSLQITKCLLRCEYGFGHGLYSIPHGILMETLVNILYHISDNANARKTDEDDDAVIEKNRIDLILDWLKNCINRTGKELSSSVNKHPSNMIFHCVACILYKASNESLVELNENLLSQLVDYSSTIDEHYTRQSLNWVLCSLYSKRPDLLASTLSSKIDLTCLSLTSSTSKLTIESSSGVKSQQRRCLNLIETLSYAIQSEPIARIFLASPFFDQFAKFFTHLVRHFTKSKIGIEASFVKLFLALAHFECGQDWLNSELGCSMWQSLIDVLNSSHDDTTSRLLANVDELTILVIRMLKRMLFAHPSNQMKFANYITKLIREASNPVNFFIDPAQPLKRHSSPTISSFLHQLILQIMLEDPTITVNFERRSSLFKSSCNSSLGSLPHPKFGTGANFRTIELPLTKTCSQVLNLLSDVPIGQVLAVAKSSSLMQHKDKDQHLFSSAANDSDGMFEVKDLLNKLKMQSSESEFAPKKCENKGRKSNNYKSQDQQQTSKYPGVPQVRLYLKESNGEERHIPSDWTLGRVLKLYLSKIKQKCVQDLTLIIKLDYSTSSGAASKTTNIGARDIVETSSSFDDSAGGEDDEDEDEEGEEEEEAEEEEDETVNDEIVTPLDAFVKCDGLIVLAERLPILMPFIHEPLLNVTDKDRLLNNQLDGQSSQQPKTSPDFVDYVIMNESDGPFVDDMYNEMPISTTVSNSMQSSNKLKKITMPLHAFIAFGLFLKIPGYATVMLRNRKQAQCILKLLLGATNNSSRNTSSTTVSGGASATSAASGAQQQSAAAAAASRESSEDYSLSLSTMPFMSLRDLLSDAASSSDKELKLSLATFIFDNRILTLILSILSNLSHHPHRHVSPHFANKMIPDNYVQAGGGGELSAAAGHHAAAQAAALAGFLGAGGNAAAAAAAAAAVAGVASGAVSEDKNSLYWAKGTGFGTGSTMQQWDAEKTLMQQKMEEEHVSCILEILSNYIECFEDNIKDSIVELFDHSCVINALSSYLRNDSVLDISRHILLYRSALRLLQSFILCTKLRALIEKCNVFDLIKNMKQFVDSYTQRIKLTEEEGDFACLVPILNETYSLVINYIKPVVEKEFNNEEYENSEGLNIEKIYCDTIKPLQFDTFPIVSEGDNSVFKANLPYYYEPSLNDISVNLNNSSRAKRLAQEAVTLSNSLPISYSSSVFVRCDEERLDIMKVMITGPQDTPYANGCFEFDVFFPSDYPESPPMINLQTTGNQTVRFNPNLYHDGKVCLSILNTWHGRPEERWNAQTSSFLQVLVSIQSLILVSEPYFNEPGYERSRGTPAGTIASIEHDANIKQATVKWAMLEMIKKPPLCFKDVVNRHFYFKRKEVKEQCELWLREMEMHLNDKQIGQSITKSSVALKRHMSQLFEILDQLKLEGDEERSENVSLNNIDSNNEQETNKKID